MKKTFKTTLGGKELSIEIGKLANRSNGSVIVKHGDTVVLSAVTASKQPKKDTDFFPLMVEYVEKSYADPRNFQNVSRRDGRPTDHAILTSRAIDRAIRPLFPKDFKNEVSVSNWVLSKGKETSPELASMIGTATALAISDVPFDGPLGSVKVGMVNDKVVLNPTLKQFSASPFKLTLTGKKDKITMIEAKANEISEEKMLDAMDKGQQEINKIADFIGSIKKEIGKPNFEYEKSEPLPIPASLYSGTRKNIHQALHINDNQKRQEVLENLEKNFVSKFEKEMSKTNTQKNLSALGKESFNKLKKDTIRELVLTERRRIDGRKIDEIRPLSAEVSVLPQTHGSAIFNRGETQVLSVVALTPITNDRNRGRNENSNFVHQYNFPGFSTGEVKPSRGPGRREIGHGALAQKAIEPVLPNPTDYPYSIAAVSEILSSNGSSSQASICGTSLALMDAGVPIKAPVAGIAAGLVTDSKDPSIHVTLLDLQGIEDGFGDMDFKVAGTKNGITAIQMDTKIDGLNKEILKEALDITKKGREQILDQVISKTIGTPRKTIPTNVPILLTIQIDPKKIGLIIGKKGATIKNITKESGARVDIKDDGKINVSSHEEKNCKKAIEIIEGIIRDAKLEHGKTSTNNKLINKPSVDNINNLPPSKKWEAILPKMYNKNKNNESTLAMNL